MDSKMIAFILVGVLVGAGIGAAAGYLIWDEDVNNDETYSFYLHFGDGDEKNGWYSAYASSTNDAFGKAMDKAEFEWDYNSYGYISMIDEEEANWMTYAYLYAETTDEAAAASVLCSVNDEWGYYSRSNGWTGTSGYDMEEGGLKMSQFDATIYFISTGATPVSAQTWMESGPFSA